MVMYNKNRGLSKRWFSAPDAGGVSGAVASGATGNGADANVKDPTVLAFEGLPWDELDADSRVKLEKARDLAVATLQSNKKLTDDLTRQVDLSKRFQSDHDRIKAELDGKQKQTQQQAPDPYVAACKEELVQAGYPDAEADKLAPVFAGMFKRAGVITKTEIGKELQPMGVAVLGNQALTAFQQATQEDPIGMFQVPEIAQSVWNIVLERTNRGEATDPALVLNLGKMAWADHVVAERAAGREFAPITTNRLPATPPIPGMNSTFNFPGSNQIIPIARTPADPNGARTVLGPEERAALAQSFKTMVGGDEKLYPKALADDIKKIGRRH